VIASWNNPGRKSTASPAALNAKSREGCRLAVQRAGNTLQTQMTEDDQKRVVVRFIKKL
jgi:hypothetical protein